MSNTVYLVRLRTAHRLYKSWEAKKVVRPTRDVEAMFLTHKQAERFVETNTPLYANPFGEDHEVSLFGGVLSRNYIEEEWQDTSGPSGFSGHDLTSAIRAAGLEPPTYAPSCERKEWSDWWDCVTESLSESEVAELKQRLDLRILCPNPFHWSSVYVSIESDSDTWIEFFNQHEILFEELQNLVESFGQNLPDIPEFYEANRALALWWDANAPQLTESQKVELWKLVDPYPYEILEVELA